MGPVSYYEDRLIGFLPPFSAGGGSAPSETPQLSASSSAPGGVTINWSSVSVYSNIVLEFRKKP